MTPLAKQHFIDCAKEIFNYHVGQLKDHPSWTIRKTALTLNRSLGSVSQYLLLAAWSVTHEKQLRRCSGMKEALEYVHEQQRIINLKEIS